jgi:Protein of unknown function (DUF3500)
MRPSRILLALALLASLAGVAFVAQRAEPPGVKMVAAAEGLVQSLTAEQKAKAIFPFDSKERTNWNFVPLQDKNRKPTRKGLPLEEMTAEQKKTALGLVRAGTSAAGAEKALTIMSLEAILRELEAPKGGTMVRNPQWYFFTVFGTPSKTGTWGWRVEGHHLSLNFVVDGGQVTAATPAFFGANPAAVQAGPRKGLRTLPEAEDLARSLFKALDADQKKVAYRDKPFPEPKQGKAEPEVGPPQGIASAKMTEDQRALLKKLVYSYAARMPAEVAEAELKRLRDAGVDKIHFAYTGGTEPGQGYTYRVQGPTFVIEFLNMQADSAGNPANHIHSVWRRIHGDFGLNGKG